MASISSTFNEQRSVTLTCIVNVHLSLQVVMDISVTVNTVWTGPADFMTNNTAQVFFSIGRITTYTSTASVNSFGRDQSGDYTCTATASSNSSFILSSTASSTTALIAGT